MHVVERVVVTYCKTGTAFAVLNTYNGVNYGQAIQHVFNDCKAYGPTGRPARAFRFDMAIVVINGGFFASQEGIYARGSNVNTQGAYFYSKRNVFDVQDGMHRFSNSWLEGGPKTSWVRGYADFRIDNCMISALKLKWDETATVEVVGGNTEPIWETYDLSVRSVFWGNRTLSAGSGRWGLGGAVLADDPDGLNGKCLQLKSGGKYAAWSVFPSMNNSLYYYGHLPGGKYKITIYAKDVTHRANDLRVYTQTRRRSGGWSTAKSKGLTLTGDYRPYVVYVKVTQGQFAYSPRGNRVLMHKRYSNNPISISHLDVEYIGGL